MKTALSILLCILSLQLAQAQKVGEIKEKARQQKEKNRNASNGSGDSNSLGNEIAGNIIGGFFEAIFSGLFSRRSPEERAYFQQLRAEKRAEGRLNPKYGLDIMMDYGGVPNEYQSYRPRLRGKIGVFSTDVRYSALREERVTGIDQFNTLDWQILQLNILNFPVASGRLGLGFSQEFETNTIYPEFATSFEFQFARQRIRLAPEYRYTWDAGAETSGVRSEFNTDLSYGLVQQRHFKLYLGLNALYARYFQSVDIWTFGVGLKMRIE